MIKKAPSVQKIIRTIKRAEKYPEQLTREELAIMEMVYNKYEQLMKMEEEREAKDGVITEERKAG